MVYDRNSRESARADRDLDYGRDHGSGRDYTYSSAREYGAAGQYGQGRDDRDGYAQGGYGSDRYGSDRYGQDQYGRSDQGRGGYSRGGYDRQAYGATDYGHDRYRRYEQQGGQRQYRGAYGSDGRPFEDAGRYRHDEDDTRRRGQQGGYGRQPQGYQYEDRGFIQRAGDEVRSWFGDDEAERRREADQRYDERADGGRSRHHDDDYHHWRSAQIASLDRDYDEYRQENRSRFNNEFATWRTGRQGQRDQLSKVSEHQEVVGSDGEHVGTVDKVKGDRILLTKNDKDAGGQHHSFPSSWITSVDDKVTLNRSAADAKQAWRDEDRQTATSTYGDNAKAGRDDQGGSDAQGRGLNRSFSGTY